ncbi:troponin I, fast skeletal muscle isoform X3 [Pteropus medius]|uniref:troponin I, fast skeletal muscle isoform X3 n=1 Tax=Pteropus vampyrus TaxID=132908 RepID=UPI00196B83CA|nr:troponin I, fast skeletal muscle isoform X3 [Pteropus giganteus]
MSRVPATTPRQGPELGERGREPGFPRRRRPCDGVRLCREDQRGQGPGCPGWPAWPGLGAGEVARRPGLWQLSRHFGQSPGPPSPWLHSELSPPATLGCLLAQADPSWLLLGRWGGGQGPQGPASQVIRPPQSPPSQQGRAMGSPTGPSGTPAPAGTTAETRLTPALTAGIPWPRWAVVTVAAVAAVLAASCLLCVLCCCCGRRTRGRKPRGKEAVGLARVRSTATPHLVQPEVDDVEPGSGGPPQWGRLQLSLHYDPRSQEIRVGLRQAEGLRARAPGGTADPYACVSLSTRAGHRHETRVHRGTLCPVFGETCRFQVPPAELPGATLLVHVRDFQRFSRHEPLGTLSLPLGTVDLQHVLELWLPLGPPGSDEAERTGELCFSLHYVPSSGRLTVVVLEARGLSTGLTGKRRARPSVWTEGPVLGAQARIAVPPSRCPEPYVKVQLMLDQRKWKKRRTSARGAAAAPYFNEAFTFHVPLGQVQSVDLVLAVWARGPRFRAEPVGKVVLGARASGQPLQHWADMLAHARRPVAQWHRLRPPSEVGQALAPEPRLRPPLPGS